MSSSGFFQVRQACPVCAGTGQIILDPCRGCGGTGRVKARRRLTLKIPPGVETGSRLRLTGKGEPGFDGGPSGDLYVHLFVRPHEIFVRRGDDLFCEVPVDFVRAALGGEIDVPTIEGPAKLKLASGTENGKVLRLRGKGIPSAHGYGNGDLLVQLTIEVPVHLNSDQKKILREFRSSSESANYPAARQFQERVERFLDRKQEMGK